MNDAPRPRRAVQPDDAPESDVAPARAADDAESTVVRDEPFSFDDDVFRRPGAPHPSPAEPPKSSTTDDAWFRPERAANGAPSAEQTHAATSTDPASDAPEVDDAEGALEDEAAPREPRLRTSVLLTLASALVPGVGLLGARKTGLKVLGATTALVAVGTLAFLGFWAVKDLPRLARFVGNETFLANAAILLACVAVVWVGLITLTQIATRPKGLTKGRRVLSGLLVTVLAFGVAAPTAVAARYSRDTSLALDSLLKSSDDVKANNQPQIGTGPDPWVDQPRVNILLLGGDGDTGREAEVAKYSIRTDTIMVASIDTKTGNTTLIQIPRNVQYTPFPEGSEMAAKFPNGFRGDGDPGEWFINTIWQHTELDYPDLMSGSTYRGADALKEGVEGVTGLKINQFVMMNINGLSALIDAMGGVTVNINQPLAMGGDTAKGIKPKNYLQPGANQHLDGFHAMWYARSRWNTDDYNRMARQSCLINAIVDQANPQTLLTNFEPIMKASADMLATDITDDQLSAYIDLAFRVKDKGTISRLVFSNGKNGYSYNNPNFEKMQAAVKKAIEASEGTAASPKPKPTGASASPTATTAPGTSASPTATPSTSAGGPSATPSKATDLEGVQNVADACTWQGD